MEMGTVSTLSIVGMIVSMAVAILLPIVLCVVVRKKTRAKFSSMLWGCGTFFLFALVLEQILHVVVLSITKTALTENIWLYGLYGGAAAAVFEETGRIITMKFIMKKNLNRENALMYGVGHGGIEAILVVGMAQISNIITAFMINGNQMDAVLGVLDETQKAATVESLSALWTTPSYQFFMSGIERISAIILHISLSILVYAGIKQGKKKIVLAAFAAHFLVDFVTVVAADKLPIVAVEIMIFLMSALLGLAAMKLYKKDAETA
jgi:uncharacterized membrane protein YhfC